MKKHKDKKEKKEKINPSEVVVEGVITEAFANAQFDVELGNGSMVRCTVCGKMQVKKIRLNPGDQVQIGVSIYDPTKGRILYRL